MSWPALCWTHTLKPCKVLHLKALQWSSQSRWTGSFSVTVGLFFVVFWSFSLKATAVWNGSLCCPLDIWKGPPPPFITPPTKMKSLLLTTPTEIGPPSATCTLSTRLRSPCASWWRVRRFKCHPEAITLQLEWLWKLSYRASHSLVKLCRVKSVFFPPLFLSVAHKFQGKKKSPSEFYSPSLQAENLANDMRYGPWIFMRTWRFKNTFSTAHTLDSERYREGMKGRQHP